MMFPEANDVDRNLDTSHTGIFLNYLEFINSHLQSFVKQGFFFGILTALLQKAIKNTKPLNKSRDLASFLQINTLISSSNRDSDTRPQIMLEFVSTHQQSSPTHHDFKVASFIMHLHISKIRPRWPLV